MSPRGIPGSGKRNAAYLRLKKKNVVPKETKADVLTFDAEPLAQFPKLFVTTNSIDRYINDSTGGLESAPLCDVSSDLDRVLVQTIRDKDTATEDITVVEYIPVKVHKFGLKLS